MLAQTEMSVVFVLKEKITLSILIDNGSILSKFLKYDNT